MAQEFRLKDPGEGIHEVEIIELHVTSGDTVADGDDLISVESDKAAIDIPAPFDGVIEDIRVEEGDTVQVGDVILTYSDQGGKGQSGEAAESGSSEAEQAQEKGKEKEKEQSQKDEAKGKKKKEEKEVTRKQRKEKEREKKEKEKEEEKEEEQSKRKERTEEKDEEEEREEEQEGETQEGEAAAKPAEQEPKDEKIGRSSLSERPIPAAPAARRTARELGVDLRQVVPSGPKHHITTEDVKKFAESKDSQQAGGHPEAGELPDFQQWGPIRREKLRSIRRATARQVTRAWSLIPHATHHDTVDITALEEFRQQHKGRVEDQGGKLTLTVLLIKAVAALLREFPRFNASLDTDSEEIILKEYYHIGVAVDTDRGLLVPVLRDVERKSLLEIAIALTELVERTRSGEAAKDDLQGSTFTLTNPGPRGGTGFDPIINYPEAAILGLGKAELQPIVEGSRDDYDIEPRLMLPITLAYDHRLNDGADAVEFMHRLKTMLGDPGQFMLSI